MANRKKQKRMTDHILNLMENRKQFKNSDKDEYNRLNKQINSACREAKKNGLSISVKRWNNWENNTNQEKCTTK